MKTKPESAFLITRIEQSPANEIAPHGSGGTWRLYIDITLEGTDVWATVTHQWYILNKPTVGQYLASFGEHKVVLDHAFVEEIQEVQAPDETYHEYKIRPITRYCLTEYHNEASTRTSSSGVVAEFNNIDQAEKVGLALHKATPGSVFTSAPSSEKTQLYCPYDVKVPDVEYVIVARHKFTPENFVYFAYDMKDALKQKAEAEIRHDLDFEIYTRYKV